MSNDRKYQKKGVTPEKIAAFIESRAGKSQQKVAAQFGVTQQTISNWTGEILDYIKQSKEYKQIPNRLISMIPNACDVYDVNLAGNELNAARDVFKMVGVYIDRQERKDTTNATNDNELKDRLAGLLATELGEDDSTPEGGSDSDSSGTGTPEDGGTEPILPTNETAPE